VEHSKRENTGKSQQICAEQFTVLIMEKAKWKRPISVNTRIHVKSSSKKVNFGNVIFKVETQRYCFLIKKFVILSETKQDRQIDLFKMK